ncbi:hypothetical protein ATCC90586_005598 [Pythium insidiosum]|nr:hypothetical protein ATCC90586_005598 [Pythium insidiosum]
MATQFDAIDLLTRYETPLLKDMEKDDDVLEWVAAFIGSESFQEVVDGYCEAHGDKFKILLTKGGPSAADLDAVESEWKELHIQFIDTANASIEAFLEAHGFTMDQYTARCDEEIRLSEERQRHTRMSFFVQILMACCEYEQFLNLMRRFADPEYFDKKELQYQAEMIVHDGNGSPEQQRQQQQSSPPQVRGAQEFLEFFEQNQNASLEELTQEFQKRVQLS